MKMTKRIPPSLEVLKQGVLDHLKEHFPTATEDALRALNFIAEVPCQCQENSILKCAICGEQLVVRLYADNVCKCVEGHI